MMKDELKNQILLDTLIAQILPALIVSDPHKADEILEYMKKNRPTIQDFLGKYPEYKGLESENNSATLKTLKFMADEASDDFLPLVNFNHEILNYLIEQIKEKNILPISEDMSYQYELRVSLYRNFNHYLGYLLSGLDKKTFNDLGQKLIEISNKEKFFEFISEKINKDQTTIINDFLNLVHK